MAATSELEIGLVVLNAGVYGFGAFLDNSVEYERNLVQLNMMVPMQLAHFLALLQQSGPDRGARVVALRQTSSRLEVQRFTEDGDSFCERTGTDAEGAFDNARFTADVLGEVEDGCLTLT